jgi:hypothetical protein
VAATAQQFNGAECQVPAEVGGRLQRLVNAWERLPEQIKLSIKALTT